MNEISEKKPLLARVKGAVLHRVRQWAKDLLLFRILPGEYRRAAKRPIQPGKVVFLENKEPAVPESFEVLYERLSRVPELDVEFISLGETRVRLRQYYRNCIEAVRDLATAQCIFLERRFQRRKLSAAARGNEGGSAVAWVRRFQEMGYEHRRSHLRRVSR